MLNGFAPDTLKEALELRGSMDLVPYAGGTDLMVQNRKDVSYLFLNKIPELKAVTADEDSVYIGAAVTFSEALKSDLIPQIMKDAVSQIAAPAIRNAGTFGGNLGNGAGKADSVPVEVAANAKLKIVSAKGERIIGVEDFYLGYRKLDLASDELIEQIILPRHGLENYYYEKVGGRNALAISRVSFAGVYAEENGRITDLAAAFGAVYGMVLRFRDIEERMIGKTKEEARLCLDEYLDAYRDRIAGLLLEDRVSEEYRVSVCINLLKEFLTKFGIAS